MFQDKKKNVCFWCGKETGEEVLLTSTPVVHTEINGRGIYSYDPCPVCKQEMDSGITFMEVRTTPVYEGHTEIMKNVYPTGNWIVATQESAERIYQKKVRKYIFLFPGEFEWILTQVEGIDYNETN